MPGNESCAASTAWHTKNRYVPATSLANRFVAYRLYWTESGMRFTTVDNVVEHDMYDAPLPVNSTSLQADVHYTVNDGTRQNVRMRLDGTTNTYSAGGLEIGDVVRYGVTYWDTARNYAAGTALQTYTMQ